MYVERKADGVPHSSLQLPLHGYIGQTSVVRAYHCAVVRTGLVEGNERHYLVYLGVVDLRGAAIVGCTKDTLNVELASGEVVGDGRVHLKPVGYHNACPIKFHQIVSVVCC